MYILSQQYYVYDTLICDTTHDAGDVKDVMVDVIWQQHVTDISTQIGQFSW